MKLAPLHRQLAKFFDHKVIHTGQHYDYNMSGAFFEEFRLPRPFRNLNVGSAAPGHQTAEMIIRLEPLLASTSPDAVMVYGDTNSTLAGVSTAAKLRIPIAHVEAGVRSFDMTMPEEVNRVVTDHVSEFLFCPTKGAMKNLANEGLSPRAYLTGDVMVEPLLSNVNSGAEKDVMVKYGLSSGQYALVTLHRVENTDDYRVLKKIIEALVQLDQKVIFPMHPRTRKALKDLGLMGVLSEARNLRLVEPIPYSEFVVLEQCAERIVTDSGGVQKEAYILGVPCVTLRERTEWPETLTNRWNVLVGHSKEKLFKAMRLRPVPTRNRSIFGGTDASAIIAKLLHRALA